MDRFRVDGIRRFCIPDRSASICAMLLVGRGLALLVALLLLWSHSFQAVAAPPSPRITPLDEYVRKPDPVFAWKTVKSIPGNPATVHFLQLTSQTWLTEHVVDRPVWNHWVVVVVPEKVRSDKALLFVGGGGNDRPMPDKPDPIVVKVAEETQSIAVELRMVPNQPLVFHQDGQPRKEDDLIGYAWDQFLKTGNPEWLPRLPMVKSVVRCMDCIQAFSKEQGHPVEKFVIAGGSKRGWTTWMTGAADPRVEAIVPIVIDVVNVELSLQHHAEVYGFWAKAIGNYYQHHILQRPDHPRMRELYRIVDPYSYLDRLTMPKYVLNASGDQFFCPDSSQFYYEELQGEKLLRYVPNADHSLRNSDAIESLVAFYQLVINGKPRPRYVWRFEGDGQIRVQSDIAPQSVVLWQATNSNARDFRLETIGPAFQNQPLAAEPDGSYVARLRHPDQGWTAGFVELQYDTGGRNRLKVSSAVRIVPEPLPFAGIDLKAAPFEGNRQP
ncbi:MAG: hypothetical protein RIS70_2997 [Planctomycetota bacterium]